ncbi:MAG: hypothetical protein AAB578_09490 [Elusimicrobiota bacterium]
MRRVLLSSALACLGFPLYAAAGSRFTAPDSGEGKTPYACTFHWFLAPDGGLLGLDLIRSDDTGRLALRAYRGRPDGSFQGWIHEAPVEEWEAFGTDAKPELGGKRNVLARGEGWIAGAVHGAPGGLEADFDLEILPESPGLGTGRLGLRLVELAATDYPRVRVKGSMTLDGERMEIDSAGIASVHYGDRLPQAAYLATVPSSSRTRLLAASARGENLRVGERFLGDAAFVYSYGSGKLPPLLFHVGRFGDPVPLGGGFRVRLTDIQAFRHVLLGVPTVTGTAFAVLEKPDPGLAPGDWLRKKWVPLGPVLFDYRGEDYLESLPL